MSRDRLPSREVLDSTGTLQPKIRWQTPIDWTVDGRTYPGGTFGDSRSPR